ncbi:hypothetical protein DSL72_007229 [Monilinia vaccinii-corymbosi]|uniref:Uncharacterized protein n=1 Tax=Monilinia vaccinii-corymbosi TaxID=61207 RepID=A0A8A3PME5_9HELO|nr:hypothetical protein DSL72_007229 [Monilinia vaccinii-corymbosi]
MSSQPSIEQIQEWKKMEFLKNSRAQQRYFETGQPLSLEHEKWLKEKENNDRQDFPGVGLPDPDTQTNESTESILPGQKIINADLDQSYISKAIICRMKLEDHIEKTQFSTYLKTLEGDLLIDGIIQIRWMNEGCRTTTQSDFYVAPSAMFNVMLGRDVLDAKKSERSS